jgi:hypothetical protein
MCTSDYDFWQSTGRHGDMSINEGNPDLHGVQKAVWGELAYTPACIGGECYLPGGPLVGN